MMNGGLEVMNVNKKSYIQVTGYVFALVTTVHGLRLLLGWEVWLGMWQIPAWFSLLAVVVAGYLTYQSSRLAK